MKTRFKESFARDPQTIKDNKLKDRVKDIIEAIERAQSSSEVPNLTKLRASGNYYRIRAGNYRIGLIVEGDEVTFVRFLHRRDIYGYFP